MTYAGNGRSAAEGVTLSGVRKDEDCILTELWRHPPCAGAEGASARRKLSGKRTKCSSFPNFSLAFLGVPCFVGTPNFYFKEEALWISFLKSSKP